VSAEITKSEFWKSVEECAKIVATWPEWKKAGVIARPVKDNEPTKDAGPL